MIYVTISENFSSSVPEEAVITAARAALQTRHVKEDEVDLTIVFDDDARIQELNQQFSGINAPTDVLSFPANVIDPETGRLYLGDIIISVPRAEVQAVEAGLKVEEELTILVVHGVLHLLGFDHYTDVDKMKMWATQKNILAELGIASDKLPE
ncbi:probable rRNA maturation factor YbeY [Anaerolinea thermolimosa]|uniref:rRNA maturation RNase YbeY n=1 Tax=Anaerolinea thermolimosa TaxID=229919 RepID=UPI0007805B86|nr:rRNA maturation RNase YbeY [Anaerolinea thermolimosa]GAP06488.1 probable rRNA maturation factor YbeY [Anaerolinea thermolimosa]